MADFLEDNSGDDNEKKIAQLEWKRLEENHRKAGFREGAALAQDDGRQEGFNRGFSAGARATLDSAKLKGLLGGLQAWVNLTSSADILPSNMSTLFDKLEQSQASAVAEAPLAEDSVHAWLKERGQLSLTTKGSKVGSDDSSVHRQLFSGNDGEKEELLKAISSSPKEPAGSFGCCSSSDCCSTKGNVELSSQDTAHEEGSCLKNNGNQCCQRSSQHCCHDNHPTHGTSTDRLRELAVDVAGALEPAGLSSLPYQMLGLGAEPPS